MKCGKNKQIYNRQVKIRNVKSILIINFIWLSISKILSFQHEVLATFSSVQSCLTLCDPMNRAGPPCPSQTPGAHSNPSPLSQWCHPTISYSVITPFSSCPQSFPASGSFPMSQLFASGDQNIGVSLLGLNSHPRLVFAIPASTVLANHSICKLFEFLTKI